MKKTFATLIVAAGLTFGAAGTASADAKAGGVTVDENATAINGLNRQIATAEDKIAIAIGNRVIAENAQATVYEHTAINGDNRQTARAGNMIAVSIGNRAYASNVQATVGAVKPYRD